jgi:chemotaxis protein MotA
MEKNMNIAALVATIGLALVTASGMTSGFTNPDGLVSFLHFPSLIIVLGGTLVSVAYASSARNINRLIKVIPEIFKAHPDRMVNTLTMMVDITKIARKNVLAIENTLPKVRNSFMKEGLQMVVDRVDREVVEKILASEMINQDQQRTADAKIVKFLSTLTPAWGMIGTLFGLFLLLKNLGGGPEVIGDAMATAILTTLYGSLFSNGLFLPWYNKLIELRDEERLYYHMIRDGILAVESNMRPELLEQDLMNYLTSELRTTYNEMKFARQKRAKSNKTAMRA